VVDIPQDLSRADIPYEPVTDVHLPGYQPTIEGNQKQIRLAAKALANARRPVIYAGGGVVNANAAAELTELATSDRFPVTCTVMGLGAFPAPHEQWLGMLGMHGTRAANYAMDEADLICAIGARFDDRITRTRSSSTSTSTRPRSPRTCRRTSRSSGTPRTSCRG
jgi:acetolactate synthase-1/2/3 large subunit